MKITIYSTKSDLILATIALAISLNPFALYAGSGSKATIPDTKGLHDSNQLHGQLTGHKSSHCPDSHKPAKECKTPTIDAISIGGMERYNHGMLEAKMGISLESLPAALRQQITEDGNCGLEEVSLSGLKQRLFVRFREKSGLGELLTLLREKCPSLTHLNLEGLTLKREDFKIIANMPSLNYLNLRGTNFTADDFKEFIGAPGTKLTKLHTLLIYPSKDGKMLQGVQYPHDFDLLPEISYFDGRVTGPLGSPQQLLAEGARLFEGKDPSSGESYSFKRDLKRMQAVREIGKQILQESKAEAAGGILEHHQSQTQHDLVHNENRNRESSPTQKDYYALGDYFSKKGHLEIAHRFFKKAFEAGQDDEQSSADEDQKRPLESAEDRTVKYKKAYADALFLYGSDLYKASGDSRNPEDVRIVAKEQIQAASEYFEEEKLPNPAKKWLTGLDKHKKQVMKRQGSIVEFSYNPSGEDTIGIKSFIRAHEQEYFSDYGCDLQQLDLGNVKIPRAERSAFTDFLARVRRECKGLKTIKLDNIPLTNKDWEEISQMEQVTALHVQDIPLSSRHLKAINRMNRLKTLHLQYRRVGNHINKSDLERYVFKIRDLSTLGLRGAFIPGKIIDKDFKRFDFYYKSVGDVYVKQPYEEKMRTK